MPYNDATIRVPLTFGKRLVRVLWGGLWLLLTGVAMFSSFLMFAGLVAEDWRPEGAANVALAWGGAILLDVVGLWLLWRAAFVALAVCRLSVRGIEYRFLWKRRLLPWTDVWEIDLSAGLRLRVGLKWVRVAARKGFGESHREAIHRIWRMALTGSGRRRLPTVPTGMVGPGVAVFAGCAAALVASLFLYVAVSPRGEPWLAAGGVLVGLLAVFCLRYAWRQLGRYYLTPEAFMLARTLGDRTIPWADAEWVRLLITEGDDAHARMLVQSRHGPTAVAMPLNARRKAVRFVIGRTTSAFLIDDNTGQVGPPEQGAYDEVRDRAVAMVGRVTRRYILHGLAGLAASAGVIVVAVLVALYVNPREHWYRLNWPLLVCLVIIGLIWGIRSFHRAARARRDLDRIIDPTLFYDARRPDPR